MSVSVKVNGVANSLVHKGSGGVSAATLPDVCKTPSPGGPVPLPYPNVSRSATLGNGTRTVKADGGHSVAVKGSEFTSSTGDSPGTLGGVKSSTIMKESTWISYSFDVKFEGRNACRLSDKKFQNHGNSADLAGEMQAITAFAQELKKIAQECDQAVDAQWDTDHPKGPTHTDCKADTGELMRDGTPKPVQVKLGELKESCVNAKVPNTAERTQQQRFSPSGEPNPKNWKGSGVPDFVLHKAGDVKEVFGVIDLKFPCPSGAGREGQWGRGQREKYMAMFPRLDANRFTLVFP